MLHRRITLLQAVSLNMAMMVGVGMFTTIPIVIESMGGPHALFAWGLGVVVAIADGLVWCELAAAFPGSGGTYHFFDAVYGPSRVGRLLKFLFIWQFLVSGPLEVASGAVGMGRYAGFLWPALRDPAWSWAPARWTVSNGQILAAALMAASVALAYRRIEVAGKLMVVLWAIMLVTVAWVLLAGLPRFDARLLAVPPGAWRLDRVFAFGLGAALGTVMYNFLGYYQVCYLGDEVTDPSRVLPRSIIVSVVAVAVMNVAVSLAVLGVVPWRDTIRNRDYVASDMVLKVQGGTAAGVVTVLILATAAGSIFSALLGYSRVPYAAARSGHFFRGLAATHPTGDFPHRSLLLVGALSALACLLDLEVLISALMTSRILIQFVGQVVTVFYIRTRPDLAARLSFRMALYPVPALVALAGWLYVFAGTSPRVVAFGLASMGIGVVVFLVWDRAVKPALESALDPEPGS